MAEDQTGATGAQVAPGTQPPAGDADAQAADADGGSSSLPETLSLEEARKLRSESQSLRKRIKAFEDAERERSDADKSAEERAAKRIAELETQLTASEAARRAASVQYGSIAVARKLGFREPELAHRLVSAQDIEFGDDGSPKNLERVLGEVAKQYPSLVAGTTDYGGGPRGSTATGSPDMNRYIRQRAGRA